MSDKAETMLQRSTAAQNSPQRPKRAVPCECGSQLMARNAQDLDQSVACCRVHGVQAEQGKPTAGSTRNPAGGLRFTALMLYSQAARSRFRSRIATLARRSWPISPAWRTTSRSYRPARER